MSNPGTCVVVLNWNNGPDTIACLASLLDREDRPSSIVVCDNASADGSAAAIVAWLARQGLAFGEWAAGDADPAWRPLAGHAAPGQATAPEVAMIHTGSNRGYAGGNNVGIRYALAKLSFDYLLIVNNDTVVTPGAIQALRERLASDPGCGLCGAKLVYSHSADRVQAWGGARYRPSLGRASHLGANTLVSETPDPAWVESRLDYVSGAATMVTRRFLEEVGLMNEDYFLYYEEIDWATRARRQGYHLGYAPQAVILHKEGASIGSSRDQKKRSLLSEHYMLSSRIQFTRRFYPWFLPSVLGFALFQAARVLARRDGRRFRIMLRAIGGFRYAG